MIDIFLPIIIVLLILLLLNNINFSKKLTENEIKELKQQHKEITNKIHEIANDNNSSIQLRAKVLSIWMNKKKEIENKIK